MADDIDIANDLIDGEISRALSKIRQNTASIVKQAKTCIECGEAIPKERQKLGYQLCVPCAEETERRKSLFTDN